MESKVNLSEMPIKKRIRYIWDYYKLWIIIGIFCLSTLISSIQQHLTAKEQLLTFIMINSSIPVSETIFAEDYLVAKEYDTTKYELVASSVKLNMTEESYQQDYYTLQSTIVRLTSGDIDIFSAPADIFEPYMEEGYLINLEDIFTEAELSQYQKYIVYTTDPNTNKTYPCAFNFSENKWIEKHGYYTGSCHIGILYNSSNPEQAKDFLLYALNF